LRFLLAHYLLDEVGSAQDVDQRIPNLHRTGCIPEPEEGPRLGKTHLIFSPLHPQLDETTGFIYLLRSPKDVLLSNLSYFRLREKFHGTDREFVEEFIREGGVPLWREAGIGTWQEHVRSWLDENPLPHLVVTFESLRRSPRETLRRVLSFLHLEVEEERLERAVEGCSLERMRSLEIAERTGGGSSVFAGSRSALEAGRYFVNEGRTGQGLSHLGEDLETAFDERFGVALAAP
jgi:hypothetical protein